jgi:hypothetical protein
LGYSGVIKLLIIIIDLSSSLCVSPETWFMWPLSGTHSTLKIDLSSWRNLYGASSQISHQSSVCFPHIVSTSTIRKFSDTIWRVNAQLYHDEANVPNTLTTNGVATQFLNRMLMDDLTGRQLSIIPSPFHFVDHVSGNSLVHCRMFHMILTACYIWEYCDANYDVNRNQHIPGTAK